MFGLGSFNPISLLATSMLGPIGGVVAQLAQQVFSQMGQQLIQQFGDKLGLPQGIIDLAQGQFAGSIGDFQGAFQNTDEALDAFGSAVGASPSDIVSAQNGIQQMMMQFIEEMSQSQEFKDAKNSGGRGAVGQPTAGTGGSAGAGGAGGASGSNSTGAPGWLMAMAQALGEELDRLGEDMQTRAESLKGDDASASAEFGVVSQQFSMLMNATNNAIKTIGEAMANTARKQ